jgi:hypothetical protein
MKGIEEYKAAFLARVIKNSIKPLIFTLRQ